MLIGVISETHGLLRPEALVALAEAEHILHAGDVGDVEILDALREIAPVTAIRGNVDIRELVRSFRLRRWWSWVGGCFIWCTRCMIWISILRRRGWRWW